MKRPILILFALALFASCKKDTPDFTGFDLDGKDTTETGGETAVIDTSKGYQPFAKDTYLKYSVTVLDKSDTISAVSTGRDTTMKGKSYHITVEKTTAESIKTYFSRSGNEYSKWEVAEGDTSELLYLKTDAEVGATWSADLFNPPATGLLATRIIGNMIEKNITRTVSGKEFKYVMHTRLDTQLDDGSGNFTTVATFNYYVAKGIGIIELDIVALSIRAQQLITDYSIK